MCLFTNEGYKTYQTGFSFGHLGHAPGVGLGGTVGGGWSKKIFFSEIQPDLVCELLTSMAQAMAQLFWSPPPGALGRGQKVKYHYLNHKVNFKDFLNQTLCVFSQMKDIKHIRRDFHSVAWVMPQGSDLGVPWGVGGSKFFFQKFNQIWCVSY